MENSYTDLVSCDIHSGARSKRAINSVRGIAETKGDGICRKKSDEIFACGELPNCGGEPARKSGVEIWEGKSEKESSKRLAWKCAEMCITGMWR
jgi:hypothetical protein